jgi:hypothetical protein
VLPTAWVSENPPSRQSAKQALGTLFERKIHPAFIAALHTRTEQGLRTRGETSDKIL